MAKTNYWLELYNNTNAARQGQLTFLKSARVTFEAEGEQRLSFEISENDPLYTSVTERYYVRLVKDTDKTYRSFIIQHITHERDNKGNLFKIVECEGLKYALMDNIVPDYNYYSNITMTDALTIALSGSGFTVGTVDASADTDANRHSVQFNWPNSLEALQLLIDTWDYDDSGTARKYLYIVNENKSIDIRERANAGSLLDFYIHPHKQLRGLRKIVDARETANKVYGIGADGFTFYRSGRVDYNFDPLTKTATGPGTGNDTLEDTVNIDTDDLHNGLTIGLRGMTGGSGADEKKTITDEDGESNYEFTVDSVWSTNPSASDAYKTAYLEETESFTYALGSYAGDTNSLAKNSEVIITINFDSNPSTATGNSTFIVRLELQNSGGSNQRVRSSYREIQSDISSEYSTSHQIVLKVEDWTDIKELKVTFVSHQYSTGAGVPYVLVTNIQYVTGRNSDFVQDTTSISSRGTIVGKYENPDILDTVNLVKTPALDGTYSAGLCENWTKVGSPTVSENTNSSYRHHGGGSQKIIAAAVDEGISQFVNVKSGVSYSAYVRVYIDETDTGSVLFKIEETGGSGEWEEVINVGEWAEVAVENFGVAGDVRQIKISVLSFGEASTFYVDAVMVHEGPKIHPFVDGDTADVLYEETITYLNQHKDPIVSYELDMLDLYEVDRGIFTEENFEIYDRVRIVDSDQKLDDHFIVMRKEFDLFDPQEAMVRLENKREYFRNSLLRAMRKTTALNRR
jgi:hypothetical protein